MVEKRSTDNEFRSKFHGNRHDNALEGVQVICISHACARPWNVDGALEGDENGDKHCGDVRDI